MATKTKGSRTESRASGATDAATETLDSMVSAGRESIDAALKAGTDAVAEAYETAASVGESQLKKSEAAYESAARMGKDNVAAFNTAAGAMVAGLEAYGEKVAEYAKAATAENLDLMGRFMSVKSPEELVSLQMEAMTHSMDRLMAQSMELNRIATETFANASAPVKEQYDTAMRSFTKSVAG